MPLQLAIERAMARDLVLASSRVSSAQTSSDCRQTRVPVANGIKRLQPAGVRCPPRPSSKRPIVCWLFSSIVTLILLIAHLRSAPASRTVASRNSTNEPTTQSQTTNIGGIGWQPSELKQRQIEHRASSELELLTSLRSEKGFTTNEALAVSAATATATAASGRSREEPKEEDNDDDDDGWEAKEDEGQRQEEARQESVILLTAGEDGANGGPNIQIEKGRRGQLAPGTSELLERARAGHLDIRVARAQVLDAAAVWPSRRRRRYAASQQQQQQQQQSNTATSRQPERSRVVIKAFNYKLVLDLELNQVLLAPNMVQKNVIPQGTHISSHHFDNCYYHATSQYRSQSSDADDSPTVVQPAAFGAFRTCNGLSGIIHVNNESLVIHPFYSVDLYGFNLDLRQNKQPHIIYRYNQAHWNGKLTANRQEDNNNLGPGGGGDGTITISECGNLHAPNGWPQSTPPPSSPIQFATNGLPVPVLGPDSLVDDRYKRDNGNWAASQQVDNLARTQLKHLLSKRDVGLADKYIELALVLSKDMFTKRNSSSRLEVLHDTIQIINCLDLYFRRSTNTRVTLVYIETWAHVDQIDIGDDPLATLYNFLAYTTSHMSSTHKDAVHLITGGHQHRFRDNSFGMSMPDTMCDPQAASVSQESSILEPFLTAATIAHLIGHNLGLDHDGPVATVAPSAAVNVTPEPTQTSTDRGGGAPSQTATAAAQMGVPLPGGDATASSMSQSGRKKTGAKGGDQTLWQAPRHDKENRQHRDQQHPSLSASSDGLTADDHEDEIKSRSLTLERPPPAASAGANQSQPLGSGDQFDTNCQGNCIMSERFVLQRPPIALGKMTQHQVPVTVGKQQSSGSSQDQVNTYTIQESIGLSSGSGGNQADNDPQQQQVQVGETTISNLATAAAAAAGLPFQFSRRSIKAYYSKLRKGGAGCLWNLPNKPESSILPTCGNGIVERDEDCDCGTRADCWTDTCCERITCKFRKDVECISGACCDGCRFRPRGFMCRRSRGECDLAEYCDGASGACAPDVHKQNGFPCGAGEGGSAAGAQSYCFMGQCPTHDSQCAELWGAHSRNSDKICYGQFNTNGTIFGNCGKPDTPTSGHSLNPQRGGAKSSSSNKFKRCEQADQMCGTLQCQLGDMKPITADLDIDTGGFGGRHSARGSSTEHEFSRKALHDSRGDHECKMITRPIGGGGGGGGGTGGHRGGGQSNSLSSPPFASSISYVRDGSKCAEGSVCFNKTCVPLERAYSDVFKLCPRDEQARFCSQHGVCSTANRCHCDPGWTGLDCSQVVELQAQQPVATSTLIEITTEQQQQHQHHMSAMSQQQQQQQPRVASEYQPATPPHTPPAWPSQSNGSGRSQASAPATPSVELTTSEPTTQAMQPPLPTQAPVSTTTTVQDKKKNESMGAQALVLILVSIVAAVYLGFALMANCYRRKGLLKPDKVLRHHQMNCKMDALRSSFIAKRLADAETLNFDGQLAASNGPHGGIGGAGGPGNQWAPLLSHNASGTSADLMSPFISPIPAINLQHPYVPPLPPPAGVQEFPLQQQQQQQQQQPQPQPPPPVHQQGQNDELTRIHMTAASSILNHTRPGAHNKPPPPPLPPHQQVRYFDPTTATNEQLMAATGSGDHIPLLGGSATTGSRPHRMLHQPMMRSFNQMQQTLADRRRAQGARRPLYQVRATDQQPPLQSTWTMRSSDLKDANDAAGGARHDSTRGGLARAPMGSFINRTTSLGSVHRQQHEQEQTEVEEEEEADDTSLMEQMDRDRQLAAQGALATPSRSLRDKRARARAGSIGYQMAASQRRGQQRAHRHQHSRDFVQHAGAEFDSCSAPSSPEHRAVGEAAAYWTSGGRGQSEDWREEEEEEEVAQLTSFVPRPSRPRHSLKQQLSFERHAGGDRSPADSPSPPPPPPPLPPLVSSHNTNDQVGPSISAEHEHHLSLIGQLQQLERVQSLHAKQVAASSGNAAGAGLHEFFSLPLSVQLSALLARSLAAESSSQQLSPVTTHIDEFLNTLNNTSVAASSRRSFKAVTTPGSSVISKQQSIIATTSFDQAQSGSSSRGGTMRKQQQNVKLQNLSSLISRLQKLQQKTMMQQQQEELAGYETNEETEGELEELAPQVNHVNQGHHHLHGAQPVTTTTSGQQSRQSTLGRPSRSGSRATNQIAAEVHRPSAGPQHGMRRSDSHRARDDHQSGGGQAQAGRPGSSSKNDLVYSMSDSEDGGAYETRQMLARPKRGVATRTRQTGGTGGTAGTPRTPSREPLEDRNSATPEKHETTHSSLADNSSAGPSLSTDGESVAKDSQAASQVAACSPVQDQTQFAKEN